MKRCQKGLTLVELLAAVAVLAILASLAVPSFGHMVQINRLKGAASELYGDLQFARFEAIQRNSCVAVTFNEAAGSYRISTVAQVAACPAAGTAIILKDVGLAAGVTMSVSGTNTIVFEPRQGSVLEPGNIAYAGMGNRRLQNQVNLLGRVRLCSPEGSVAGYSPC